MFFDNIMLITAFLVTLLSTECARDYDLYKLVSCGKFVNDILFSTIYKTHYLTLGHHDLAVILCLYLNFFELSTA
jgi:hypothetical protein